MLAVIEDEGLHRANIKVYRPMEWVVTCHVTCPANPVTKVFDPSLM